MGLLYDIYVEGKKWYVIDITFSQRRACSVGEPQENRGNRYKEEESFMLK